jgi:hypothetical protein
MLFSIANKRAAKRRGRRGHGRHTAERGSALFLVVLVLSLLTAIGMFSMRSASLVDVATGYNRQSVQAANLAEYAARMSATYIGRGGGFVERASTERVAGCASAFLAANPNAGCTVLTGGDLLLSEFSRTATNGIPDGLSGLLSSASNPIQLQGQFVTELTAPSDTSQRPGFADGQFRQVTFTAIATVFPTDATARTACDPGAREALSRQAVRAHVIVPAL